MKLIYSTIALLTILLCIANSATFNLKSTTTCTTFDANGACTVWSQSGSIDQQTAACFQKQTLVKTKNGFKQMQHLQIGDFISTIVDQRQDWTQVKGWFHKNQSAITEYLNVTVNGSWFLVSAKHNIAYLDDSTQKYYFDFAEELLNNKKLFSNLGKINVQIVKGNGMYSPITDSFTYFVYPSQESDPILAHNFANVRTPQFYQNPVKIILSVSEFIYGDKQDENGINIGAKWMMDNFKFLME